MDLEETRAFLAVLDHGSFKSAAESVRQPRATLRRRVEALEVRAGVALLERSRAGVTPTPAGDLFARQARVLVREAGALLDVLRTVASEPSGTMRVAVPVGLPAQGLAMMFGLFQAQNRDVSLDLQTCDDPLAELEAGADLALHFGDNREPGRWQTHTLLHVNESLRASPTYLRRHGVPRSLDELRDHELLACRRPDGQVERWPVRDGTDLQISPSLTTGDPLLLRRFASLGLGIALLPDSQLPDNDQPETLDEALVPVLSGHIGRTRSLCFSVAEVLAETPNLRAARDHLERFASLVREPASHGRASKSASGPVLQLI